MPLASDLSLSIAALYKLRIYLRIKNVPFMILLQIEKYLIPAHVSCLIIAAHRVSASYSNIQMQKLRLRVLDE